MDWMNKYSKPMERNKPNLLIQTKQIKLYLLNSNEATEADYNFFVINLDDV